MGRSSSCGKEKSINNFTETSYSSGTISCETSGQAPREQTKLEMGGFMKLWRNAGLFRPREIENEEAMSYSDGPWAKNVLLKTEVVANYGDKLERRQSWWATKLEWD